jgi:tetratricopeptide (TPR) repeat protein
MHKLIRNNTALAIILTSIFLSGCGTNAGTSDVAIKETAAEVTESTHETIHMNNCGGKGDAKQVAKRSKSVNVEYSGKISVDKVVVEGEVSAKYNEVNENTKSLELVAPAGTNMDFDILWTEKTWIGIVTEQGKDGQGNYKVSVPISVELISSQDLGCESNQISSTLPSVSSNAADDLNKGNQNFNNGNYEQAIAYFSEAIRLEPNYAEAYFNRGDSYYNTEKYNEAIADYTKAINLNYKLYLAYSKRGDSYIEIGNLDLALPDLNQAIILKPDYAAAYTYRGFVYFQKGDEDRALTDLNLAIQLDNSIDVAYYSRGFIYNEKGEYDKAISDMNHVIQLDPQNALAYRELGYAYTGKGDKEAALAAYKKVIEVAPNSQLSQDAEQKIKYLEQQP